MADNPRKFRARFNNETLDIVLGDDRVSLGSEELPYSVANGSARWLHLLIDGRSHNVYVRPLDDGRFEVWVDGKLVEFGLQNERDLLLERFGLEADRKNLHNEIRAPMPGLVVDTLVSEGEAVDAGQGLVVLEAMKMENEIKSIAQGTVKEVHVKAGQAVGKNALLVVLE